MNTFFNAMTERAKGLQHIDTGEAVQLYTEGVKRPFPLIACANEIREHFKDRRVSLCEIVNAKSGICPENCRFCAQSAHYHTDAPVYPLLTAGEIVEKAKIAGQDGAHYFGIVTSGTTITSEEEWHEIYRAAEGINFLDIRPCASIGMINATKAAELKEAGMFRYHHNLETARSFFDCICTTHRYEEDIESVRAAKRAGLSVCSGGIIGLGETMEQRIELALTLRELDVDSVPINILNPIPGTPLMNTQPLSPIEILLTVALFRFILPDKDIKLCGGKEKNLRQLLPLSIMAGCNSLMTGNYLTTPGHDSNQDIEIIKDLGMTLSRD